MLLGHFAAGVATKPAAETLPIWALLLAPQALDIVFLPLVGSGVEEFEQGDYGQDGIEAFYSHSIVGAVFISAAVFWIGKKLWKSSTGAWVLALLSFSHWPIDLVVHHEDLPILPGNHWRYVHGDGSFGSRPASGMIAFSTTDAPQLSTIPWELR
jgi:hypothetical protein